MENLLKKSPVFIVLHSFQKRKKTAPDVPRINLWKTRVSISFHSSRMPPSRRCLSFRPHPEALSASVMSSSALVSTKHSFTHPSWARHPESHWFLARDTRSSLCWLSVGQPQPGSWLPPDWGPRQWEHGKVKQDRRHSLFIIQQRKFHPFCLVGSSEVSC